MSAANTITVPSQPGTDFGEMTLVDRNGQLQIIREKRSNSGVVRTHGLVELSKHQQIALRDWLCERWGKP